ncbi:MAG: YitT family protein [Culicoidibacterales bacterium]
MSVLNYFDRQSRMYQFLAVIIGAVVYAVGFKLFIQPAALYSGGLSGVSQLLVLVSERFFNIPLDLGVILFALNIPLFIFGWFKVSRRFTLLSILSVGITSTLFAVLPPIAISDDTIVNVVFGGILVGSGVGLSLRYGGSTGGMDIITMYLAGKSDQSFAKYSLVMNIVIIFFAAILNDIQPALYTLILLYVQSLVVNSIHTSHMKYTLFIITSQADELIDALTQANHRGITVFDAVGAYTNQPKKTLMTVVTSYQLYDSQELIHRVDQQAFVDILPTHQIQGRFAKVK